LSKYSSKTATCTSALRPQSQAPIHGISRIAVASNPAENAANAGLPIRVFFVNLDGYLADIYQSIWGGPWNNGSLSRRQFTVPLPTKGGWYNSISADWCSGAIVYAQGTDRILYGFEISGDDDQGNGGTWDIAWQKSLEDFDEVVNIATVCLPNTGVLFINTGSTDTGQLVSWFNTSTSDDPLFLKSSLILHLFLPINSYYYYHD
jgi:hypothetical protein